MKKQRVLTHIIPVAIIGMLVLLTTVASVAWEFRVILPTGHLLKIDCGTIDVGWNSQEPAGRFVFRRHHHSFEAWFDFNRTPQWWLLQIPIWAWGLAAYVGWIGYWHLKSYSTSAEYDNRSPNLH